MRIGTWNLAGRWSPAHRDLLVAQYCEGTIWSPTRVSAVGPDGELFDHDAYLVDVA